MNFLDVVLHLGPVLRLARDVEDVVQNLVQRKENFPSKEEWLKLLADVEALIGSGVIKINGVETSQLQDIVKGLKDAVGGGA